MAVSSPEPQADWESSDAELYERTKLAFVERRASQENFVEQIDALMSHPEITPSLADGSLTLKTLFYRAEAELFVVYQPEKDAFELLA